METIILKPLQYNGAENIALYFPNDIVLNKVLRKIEKARWTVTHKCWYVPWSKQKYEEIVQGFKGLAHLDNSAVKIYFAGEKQTAHGHQKSDSADTKSGKGTTSAIRQGIHTVNAHV